MYVCVFRMCPGQVTVIKNIHALNCFTLHEYLLRRVFHMEQYITRKQGPVCGEAQFSGRRLVVLLT